MDYFSLISDICLILAAVALAIWCRMLSRRLTAFNQLDSDMEAKVSDLTAQVEDLRTALTVATHEGRDCEAALRTSLAQADDRIGRMDILLTSLEALEEEASEAILAPDAGVSATVEIPSFRHVPPVSARQGDAR